MPGYLFIFTVNGNLIALEFKDNQEFTEQVAKLKASGFRSVESVLKENMSQINLSVLDSVMDHTKPKSKIAPIDIHRTWECPKHGDRNVRPSKSGGFFCACKDGDHFCKEKSKK